MSTGTRLFVGNLPENTNENELRSAFSSYGEITSVDLKNKTGSTEEQKKFAFVTISSSNLDIETCIKHFSIEDFKGARLYVTRARESFLERLQRERQEALRREEEKERQHDELPKKNPVMKLGDKLNPRKRKTDTVQSDPIYLSKLIKPVQKPKQLKSAFHNGFETVNETLPEGEKKKKDSEKKRLESMKKKRQEFKEKQMIIKTGLTHVDKTPNKKVIFSDSDNEDNTPAPINGHTRKPQHKNTLFDDNEDSGDEVNFDIKEQFEGRKGQKVLDLQSRYKSDKRFVLDERFIDGDQSETEEQKKEETDQIELDPTDEKTRQLSILQDVLGVAIKTKSNDQNNKKSNKTKLGMLRFDPMQPEHSKFLMPVEEKKQDSKKNKKKNKDKKDEIEPEQVQEVMEEKVEVSKEQFYKVSDTLKEAIAQPTSFSLRSLFTRNDEDNVQQDQEMQYIPLETPSKPKVKNPMDPGEKNPFVYDSSDSEPEEEVKEVKENTTTVSQPEAKAVWKENLFFSKDDTRLKEALMFFNKPVETEVQKERRELKSLMKKRIYNKERKNQMFQKKIGGRKKSMKKSYNKSKPKHN